jgi:hypothetical protein
LDYIFDMYKVEQALAPYGGIIYVDSLDGLYNQPHNFNQVVFDEIKSENIESNLKILHRFHYERKEIP